MGLWWFRSLRKVPGPAWVYGRHETVCGKREGTWREEKVQTGDEPGDVTRQRGAE